LILTPHNTIENDSPVTFRYSGTSNYYPDIASILVVAECKITHEKGDENGIFNQMILSL